MESASSDRDVSRSRIMLGLLESVARNGSESQRARASEFGVALGLVNAYLNYCVKKGLIRVRRIPAKRYAYYLTPKGFAEKSRLAVSLISNSFHSFRLARIQYTEAFRLLSEHEIKRVVLVGLSELAEVAVLSAADTEVIVAAIIDPGATVDRYLGLPVLTGWKDVPGGYDGAVITDLVDPAASRTIAATMVREDKIVVPPILGVTGERQAAE